MNPMESAEPTSMNDQTHDANPCFCLEIRVYWRSFAVKLKTCDSARILQSKIGLDERADFNEIRPLSNHSAVLRNDLGAILPGPGQMSSVSISISIFRAGEQ